MFGMGRMGRGLRACGRAGCYLAVLLLAVPAQAAVPVCGDRDHIASELQRQHGEKPVARGVLLDGMHVLEVFVAPSGSFTVVITSALGLACIPAAGLGWEDLRGPSKTGFSPATDRT